MTIRHKALGGYWKSQSQNGRSIFARGGIDLEGQELRESMFEDQRLDLLSRYSRQANLFCSPCFKERISFFSFFSFPIHSYVSKNKSNIVLEGRTTVRVGPVGAGAEVNRAMNEVSNLFNGVCA